MESGGRSRVKIHLWPPNLYVTDDKLIDTLKLVTKSIWETDISKSKKKRKMAHVSSVLLFDYHRDGSVAMLPWHIRTYVRCHGYDK